MIRRLLTVGCVAAAGLTPIGAGTASAEPAGASALVAPGKITSVLVPKADLSDLIGVAIEKEVAGRRPGKPVDLGKDSACAALLEPNADTFGKSFTAYRFQTDLDAETAKDADYLIDQQVATYQDEDAAAKVFQAAFGRSAARQCNDRRVRPADAPDTIQVEIRVDAVTATHATWETEIVYEDELIGRVCASEAGVQGNVFYTASVCQFGNSAPLAATIAQQMDSQASGVRG